MPKKKIPAAEKPGLVRESSVEYRAARRLSATEAARGFSELLNRVRYRGESFIIERGGVPIGELRPAGPVRFTSADLVTLLKSLPPVDEEFCDDVAEAIENQGFLPESPWAR